MSAPVVRSVGSLTIAGAQPSLTVVLPPRKVGDILFVHYQGYNFSSTNDGLPEDPPGAEVLHTNQTTSDGEVWWAIRVLNADVAQLTLNGSSGFNLSWAVQIWVVTNVTPSLTWFDVEGVTTNVSGEIFPAVTVSGDDRLVLGLIRGIQLGSAPGPFAPPAGFTRYQENVGDIIGVFYQYNLVSIPTDASTPATPYTHSNSSDGIFYISIIGVDDTPLPAQPQPGRVRYNCATSYTARIAGADYRTAIDVVGWSRIKWSRILDDISSADVVIPDIYGGVRCCIPHGGIAPWRFGLIIERNDVEVWKGPIVSINRDPGTGTTTISARDLLVRYMKRFAVRDGIVNWVNTDAGTAFAGVINTHARSSDDAWFVECPEVFTGAGVTRRLIPDAGEMAWDVLSELLGSAVDAYVANGVLYVWEPGAGWQFIDGHKRTVDGPYNSNYDLVYGLFTAEAFTALPRWDVDGMSMENFVAIPSADTGEFGFRQIWTAESVESQQEYGVLDHMEPNTLNLPEDTTPSEVAAVLQARANTVRDLHAMPPVVVSGGSLAEGAPVDVDGLRPGSIWVMDIFDACYGQLRVANRLKSVEVSVTTGADGLNETVSPTMFPPGFEEGEQFV